MKPKTKHNLRKLNIWSDAVDLAVVVYQITATFPKEEKFGLVSQLNRAAVSVASNIAEGVGRNTVGEQKHFLGVAIGSSNEMLTQMVIANRLKFVDDTTLDMIEDRVDKSQRSIHNFSKTLEDKKNN